MNFKDVDLQVFIKFISELTGKNFLIDPNVKGTVTIISPQKVTVDEVYKVFLSVLEVNGFTVIEAGQVSKIVPTAAAKTKAIETFLEKKLRTPEDKIVTQLVPLKHADSVNLARLLASLVEKTGLLVPYAETNTLIVIDTLSNINRLVRIITELDVPGDEEIWVTQLKYAKADDLAKKLATLFQERRGAAAGAGQQAGLVRADLKILPDERTNSLVVLAGPNPMAKIKLLVDKLDQRQARPRENIHIYSLQNAVAENLAKVLMEIPGKGTKDEKAKAAPVSKDVQISADKATNTLVIIAEPEEYAILEEVIRKLDEPRPMVYVEALIMEVSATKALDLGVEWRVGNTYDGGYGAGQPGGVYFGGSQRIEQPCRRRHQHWNDLRAAGRLCGRRHRQGHHPRVHHLPHHSGLCEGGENGQRLQRDLHPSDSHPRQRGSEHRGGPEHPLCHPGGRVEPDDGQTHTELSIQGRGCDAQGHASDQ